MMINHLFINDGVCDYIPNKMDSAVKFIIFTSSRFNIAVLNIAGFFS